MKLGTEITYAGRTGTVTAIRGHVAYCLTADGKRFQAPRLRERGSYRKSNRPVEVRVRGHTDWLAAEWIGKHQLRITAPDPIWRGCPVADSTVEVRNPCT